MAILVAIATAIAAGPASLSAPIMAAWRHAICVVGAGICTPEAARRAGLDACLVELRSDHETLGAVVAAVRLRRGDTMVLERRSDGTATVSFIDDHAVGGEYGVGARLGTVAAGGDAKARAGVNFTRGRSYEFASWKRAQDFARRHAADETAAGESLDLVRRISPVHSPRRVPPPAAVLFEAGAWTELEAQLGTPLSVRGRHLDGHAGGAAAGVIGRRRSGRTTKWYLNVHHGVAGQLGLIAGSMGAASSSDSLLEVDFEGDRPVAAAVTGSVAVAGDIGLYGHTTDLGALAGRLRAAAADAATGGRGGMAMEVRVSLDLRDAANRRALVSALESLTGRGSVSTRAQRLRQLGERLDRDGRVDISVYRSRSDEHRQAAEIAAGVGIGAERLRRSDTRDLVAAWSAHGGAVRERGDCVPGAQL